MLKIATKFAPTPVAFAQAWQAGFRYAEFWLSAALLQDVEQIISQAQRYPFGYVPHLPNKQVESETIQQTARLCRKLKCSALVLHQPMMDRWGEDLQARLPDVSLAVENHVLNETEFESWAEKNPGLNLDIEHLWKFTLRDAPLARLEQTLADFLRRHGHKLQHVHLPGYLPGQEEHRPMYCSRELMYVAWGQLHDLGYAGLVVSEINGPYQNPQDLRMDMLLFERWWLTRQNIVES